MSTEVDTVDLIRIMVKYSSIVYFIYETRTSRLLLSTILVVTTQDEGCWKERCLYIQANWPSNRLLLSVPVA